MTPNKHINRAIGCLVLVSQAIFAPASFAAPEDQVNADGTTITGNRELPLGLYIIPWRDPDPVEIENQPTRLVVEELVPLDPDVFRRQIRYHEDIHGKSANQ